MDIPKRVEIEVRHAGEGGFAVELRAKSNADPFDIGATAHDRYAALYIPDAHALREYAQAFAGVADMLEEHAETLERAANTRAALARRSTP